MPHERIEINPDIMGGKPVVRGTRIPVETVLRKLGAGMTAEAILAHHPRLTREDILAATRFDPSDQHGSAPRALLTGGGQKVKCTLGKLD